MGTSLVASQASKLAAVFGIPDSQELVTVLKSTAFKGQVSDAQMSALLIVANQYKLNPWTKEIYAFPDKNNGIVPVVGVDGWARIINEHPQFDGLDFEQDNESCTCIIYRKDRSRPIHVTEFMAECRRDTGPWKSHPKRMLRHKALIQAARLAFGFVGVYDPDEAEALVEKDVTPRAEVSMPRPRQEPAQAPTPPRSQPRPAPQPGAAPEPPKAEPAPAVIDNETGEVIEPPKPAKAPESPKPASSAASAGMFSLCRKKAEQKGISEDQILEAFGLQTLESADTTKVNAILKWIRDAA